MRYVANPDRVHDTDQITMRTARIVVGVDGSSGSRAALRWALTQARLTGAEVEAIEAWQDAAMYGYSYGLVPALLEAPELPEQLVKALAETVSRLVGETDPAVPPVPVVQHVTQGHPAQVLVTAAASADLLVVGRRGHGTLAGMLLGSVSQYCVHHATCPVVVVPDS